MMKILKHKLNKALTMKLVLVQTSVKKKNKTLKKLISQLPNKQTVKRQMIKTLFLKQNKVKQAKILLILKINKAKITKMKSFRIMNKIIQKILQKRINQNLIKIKNPNNKVLNQTAKLKIATQKILFYHYLILFTLKSTI